jgi:hypothetical protein
VTSASENVDPEVLKTIIDSYYSRGVEAADRARERAERGYTIASAIAAALVAAGVFAHLSERPTAVQVLGLTALGAWLVAAVLFIFAVAVPVSSPSETDPGWDTEAQFVEGVRKEVAGEVNTLRLRQMFAVVATVVAMLLTVAAFAWATADPGGASPEKARVVVTAKADAALTKLCPGVQDLYGTLDPDDLDESVISVEAPPGECGPEATSVQTQTANIVAVEKVKRFPRFP